MPDGSTGNLRKEMNGVSADVANKINAINSRFDAMGIEEIKSGIETLRKDAALANDDKEIIRKLQESVDSINAKTCKMLTLKDIESLKNESEDARICANLILDKKIENLGKEMNGLSNDYKNSLESINSRIDGVPDGEAMDEIKTAVESLIKDVESAKAEKSIAVNNWNEAMKKFEKSIDSMNSRLSGMLTAKDGEEFRKDIELLKRGTADTKKDAVSETKAKRCDFERISKEFAKNVESINARIDGLPKVDADLLRKDVEALKRNADQRLKQLADEVNAASKNACDAKSRVDGIIKLSNDMDGMRRCIDSLKKDMDDARKGAHIPEMEPTRVADSADSSRSKMDERSEPIVLKKTQEKLMEGERVKESGDKTDAMKRRHEAGKAHESERRDNNGHKAEMIMIEGPRAVAALEEPKEKVLPDSEANGDSNADISRLKKRYELIEGKVKADKRAGRDVSHEEMLLENASFELTVAELCLLEGDVEPCRQKIEKAGEMLEKAM